MVLEPVLCPDCQSSDVVKHGQYAAGKQRYRCRNHRLSPQIAIADWNNSCMSEWAIVANFVSPSPVSAITEIGDVEKGDRRLCKTLCFRQLIGIKPLRSQKCLKLFSPLLFS